VSHDPESKFAAQETFLIIINVKNSCAAYYYFCGNHDFFIFFQNSLMNRIKSMHPWWIKYLTTFRTVVYGIFAIAIHNFMFFLDFISWIDFFWASNLKMKNIKNQSFSAQLHSCLYSYCLIRNVIRNDTMMENSAKFPSYILVNWLKRVYNQHCATNIYSILQAVIIWWTWDK